MSEIPLNKFEKHALVIRLLKEGKTYREICNIAHIAPRDVKSISKKYEQQKRLENNKRKRNNQKSTTKKLSSSTQAFVHYKKDKNPSEVKILLDIPFRLSMRYWKQYLKSIGMEDFYEFYQDHSNDIPRFLSINIFMKRHNLYGNDIVKILRQIQDVISLNKMISNLKEELKQTKNNYSLNQNNMRNHYLPPLGPLPKYYNW